MSRKALVVIALLIIVGGAVFLTAFTTKGERLKPASDVIGQEAICPVLNTTFTITEQTPVIEYRDELYYFCCAGCDTDFLKDPERYIRGLDDDTPFVTELDEGMIGKEAICPVTKEKFIITETTPVVEYKNEKYYMCCPGCDTDFIENPEQYIENNQESAPSESRNGDILYWTCSMHPEVKSEEEGNCPICAMALTPVLKKIGADNSLFLDEKAILLAGIKLAPATRNQLHKELQAVGRVAYDPELVIAQEEYINAVEMIEALEGADEITVARANKVLDTSRYKLKLLGMDDSEIQNLKVNKKVDRSLIMPEYKTWVYADIYESDIRWVKKGQEVLVRSISYPDVEFTGRVISINPVLNDMTRSVQVRIALNDTKLLLKPGMYVDVVIKARYDTPADQKEHGVVTVPKLAVLDTGNHKFVWVYLGDGNFEPRKVRTGPVGVVRTEKVNIPSYPILDGIDENDVIVTNGNFLMDSESRISGIAALSYSGAIGVDEHDEDVDNDEYDR